MICLLVVKLRLSPSFGNFLDVLYCESRKIFYTSIFKCTHFIRQNVIDVLEIGTYCHGNFIQFHRITSIQIYYNIVSIWKVEKISKLFCIVRLKYRHYWKRKEKKFLRAGSKCETKGWKIRTWGFLFQYNHQNNGYLTQKNAIKKIT